MFSSLGGLSTPLAQRDEVRRAARLVCLVRLLLLAMTVGLFAVVGIYRNSRYFGLGADYVLTLLIGVMVTALLFVVAVPWVVTRRQLVVHLVFDLLWCTGAIYLSGGVLGPGTPLVFAVVLTANLALPRVLPFVLPSIAALMLAVVALLYAGGKVPFPEAFHLDNPRLFEPNALVGTYLVQALALFVVDALGQALAARLHEQRLLIGDMLDQLGDGVIALDRQWAPIHVNDEAMRLLDLRQQDRFDPLAVCRERAALRPLWDMFRADGQIVQAMEGPRGRWLRVRVGNLHGRAQRVIGRVMTLADETDLRRAEANAQRYEHLAQLGEMAAGIAHEIRNPLTSLRGCAQELGEMHEEAGQLDAAALSGIILSESDRLARIIDDFLHLSRQHDPTPEGVDLERALEMVAAQIRHRDDLPEHLVIEKEIDAHCPLAAVDPDHLQQILLNLANNSIHALRDRSDGVVRLAARSAAGLITGEPSVAVTVSDNGPGIDPAIADDLFTPFVSGRAQGTGLGLAVVQRLAQANGGLVDVGSNPDGGASFALLLPVWRAASER